MKSIATFLLISFLSTTPLATAQQISGTIFNDYNSNGIRNTNSPGYYEGGSPGIPIRLRDCTQDLEILTYTNELGGYLFNVIEGCYFLYLEDQYSVAPYVQPGGVEETNQIFPGNGRSYEFYVKEGESVVVNVGIVPEGFGVAAVQETTVAASTTVIAETTTSSSAAATTTENYSQIFFAADIDDSTDVVDVPDETTTSTSSSATELSASEYYAGDSTDVLDSESSHAMASHVNAFDAQTSTMGSVLYDAIEEPAAHEAESLIYSGESETTTIAPANELIDEAASGTEGLSNNMSSVDSTEESYISQAQVMISTTEPTEKPTQKPTMSPFSEPSATPTLRPSNKPTAEPIASPTVKPSVRPTLKPTDSPTLKSSASPISSPTAPPTLKQNETTIPDPTALSDTEPIIDSTESAENEITSPQGNETDTNSTQTLFIQASENETAALDSALSSIAEFVVSSTENETDTNSALSSIADYVNQTKDNETTTSSSSAPSSNITDNQVSITAIKTNSTETMTTDTPTAKPTTCIGCTLYLAAQVRIQLDHIENKLSENSKTLFEGVCASFLEEQLEIATPPIEDLNCTLVEERFEVQADNRALRHSERLLSTTLYHADVEVTGTALSTSSHQTPESIKFKQLCVGTFTVQGFLFVRALKEAEENATSSSSEGVFSSVENARGIMTYDASEANSGDESLDDPSNPSTGWLTTQVLAGIAAASVFCALCFMFLIVKRARRRRSRRRKYNDLDEDSDKVMPMSRNVITADIYEDFPELKRPKSDIRKPSSDDSTVPMGSPGTSPTSSDSSTSARIASIIKKRPTSPNSPSGPKLITPVSIRSNNEEIEVDMIPDSFSGDQQKRGKARASSMLNSRVRRNLIAPAGKLGIMVANTSGFGPAVHTMREGSPMEGLMFVNDIIIAINGVNTRECTAAEITEMMKETADRERKITVLSSVR